MLAFAKRDMALRQFESYRDGVGRRLRLVSDGFITEQADGAAAAPAQLEASTVQPQ
jgi:hypothetical protein